MNSHTDTSVLNLLGLIHGVLERIDQKLEQQVWHCGCGTVNAVSLTYCRNCKRREGEPA